MIYSDSDIWLNRIIGIIIKEVESNISKNMLLANFRMGPLPTLCKKFVELVEILVSYRRDKFLTIFAICGSLEKLK